MCTSLSKNIRGETRGALLISLFLFGACLAREGDKPITFEMAFENGEPRITLTTDRADGWLDEEHYLWIERNEGEKPNYYKVNAKSGKKTPYVKPDTHDENQQESADRKAEAWTEDGDLYYAGIEKGTVRRLTRSKGAERNPRFSPDGLWLAYTRDHNLYAMQIATGLEVQLTADGSDTVYNGYASWVYYEEILGRASRYCAFRWSPDSSKLLFMRFDDRPVKTFSIYHADGKEDGEYGSVEVTRYPKSGEDNPWIRMGVVEVATGEIAWLDFDEREDSYLAWPFWTPDSLSIYVQWMNRDQNHLVIYACDAGDGSKKAVYQEKQETWVQFFEDITYLQDGSGFILRSDKDGWRHLYLHAMDGSLKKRLTSGSWSVTGILAVDRKKGKVYFTGRKEDTSGSDLFSVNLDGSGFKTITKPGGSHRVTLSPGLRYYLDVFSDYRTPRQVNLHKISGKRIRQLADSTNPEAADYRMGKTEFFRVPSTDGVSLPAWWVIPKDLDPKDGNKKYGVIFRIYSGPGSSTVRNAYRRTWRDHYFADHGIITISVDHRGSGHFGKQGEASMYRKFGFWELHDLTQAVKWLRDKPFIDPNRIGITGHSYGGYMTLLALTKGNQYFTHGVAGAPVTDWALYDTVYTERYMDRPQDNKEGYQKGSILTYADQLKGALRLIHGEIDDNVHLQNSVRLVDILTRENIQFEYMVYPGSRHGIRQHRHWLDGENTFWFRHFLGRPFQKEAKP